MGEPIVLEDFKERVILVGVSEQDGDDAEDSLAELAELVKTAGASVAGTLIQKRELIHPGTYVGTGKVAEIAELLEHTGATGIVCDDELSPAQLKNLETMLNTKVMDRTLIILDIFAVRATTSEGKIQVELAQLKYRLSRLTGLGRSMSRLGGGIGTRGPGEKKLEIDRRLINDRIAQLNRELKEVVKHREIARAKRERNAVPVVAIVGYTNAGKSTMINKIIYNYFDNTTSITTSMIPSTTLDTIEISLNGLTLIDTPGILDENSYIEKVDYKVLKKITPRREIKPTTYQIKTKQTIFISDLVRIDALSKSNITIYVSNDLKLERTFKNSNKLNEYVLHKIILKESADIVISGLGFIKATSGEYDIYALENVAVFTRDCLI